MLPLLLGLAKVMYRANMAIQQSIVNQQFARQQTLILTGHSPYYPARIKGDGSPGPRAVLAEKQTNVLLVGVSENQFLQAESGQTPIASKQLIARTRGVAGGEGPAQEEPRERAWVRIRTTVALCTPSAVINSDSGIVEAGPLTAVSGQSSMYCHNPYNDVAGSEP